MILSFGLRPMFGLVFGREDGAFFLLVGPLLILVERSYL